jgi:hypothetical protein
VASAAAARIVALQDAVVDSKRVDEGASCTPLKMTLLELVEALSSITDDEREVVATVIAMLTHGSVKLQGNFREKPPETFFD